MSKKATKMKYWWQFKTIGVNKTRSCASKLKYLPLYKWFWIFCFTFPKKWVGWAMGNETFYGDGLMIYFIGQIILAFWLVLTSDLLEDKCIDNVISSGFWFSQLYKTSRFHVVVHLFNNRSQRTSKCGKNIADTLAISLCANFLFLPHWSFTEQTHSNMESVG